VAWRRIAPGAVAAGTLALLLSACGDGLPEPATEQADDTARLWIVFLVAAGVVGGATMALILWAALRYRRRSDELPDQRHSNVKLEALYTAVPVLIVAVLFGLSVVAEEEVTHLSDDPDVVVDVVGYQWQWSFTYPDERVESLPGPAGELPELVLPVGSSVRFNLVGADVIHSFWVPEFLSKRDLIPGVHNSIEVTVTRPGVWTGRCAEFCGLDHWKMSFTVRAVAPEEYEAWLDERRAAAA